MPSTIEVMRIDNADSTTVDTVIQSISVKIAHSGTGRTDQSPVLPLKLIGAHVMDLWMI